jgi:hypothetical protein
LEEVDGNVKDAANSGSAANSQAQLGAKNPALNRLTLKRKASISEADARAVARKLDFTKVKQGQASP